MSDVVKNSRVACFADDTKIFRCMDSIQMSLCFSLISLICTPGPPQVAWSSIKTNTHSNIRRERPWYMGNQRPYLVQTCFRTMCKGKQTAWLHSNVWLRNNQHMDPPYPLFVCCSACPSLRQPSVVSPVHRAY